jgi:hypothetical protein
VCGQFCMLHGRKTLAVCAKISCHPL